MSRLPSRPVMYRALRRRDSSFEGIFYAGVRTTGVFCRPTCPARKPKPVNVEFFTSPHAALCAGYRPCSRCRPMDSNRKPPALVQRLQEAVENSANGRLTDADLRAMGIDPSTARRQFQRYHGVSFHAFQRTRRMEMALRDVRGGESVIGAQIRHGFQSASGFWEAFRRVFGAPPSRSEGIRCLLASRLETPLGAMLALADDRGVHLLEFVDRKGLEREIVTVRKRAECTVLPGSNRILKVLDSELKEYFEGMRKSFTVPLVIAGSPFEKSVWSMLRKIKAGETWSYAQVARSIGQPRSHRAVARANGRNCLTIVVPCHRVIRADGSVSGYGGGVWRKRWLIGHERAMAHRE